MDGRACYMIEIMKSNLIRRRSTAVLAVIVTLLGVWAASMAQPNLVPIAPETRQQFFGGSDALGELDRLPVKDRAPKTGYKRQQFSDGWSKIDGCSVREIILSRDLSDEKTDGCKVLSGKLDDPYTGRTIEFQRGPDTSPQVQIDHVVALSNAWQTGAQQLSTAERQMLANDPLNLLAVDGPANQTKGDSDAAEWLPENKTFHCEYASRQVAVKRKYRLWVTAPERTALQKILQACKN